MTIDKDQYTADQDGGSNSDGSFDFGDFADGTSSVGETLGDLRNDPAAVDQFVRSNGFTPVFAEDGTFSGFYKNGSNELISKADVQDSLGIDIEDPVASGLGYGDNLDSGDDIWNLPPDATGDAQSQNISSTDAAAFVSRSIGGISSVTVNDIAQGATRVAESVVKFFTGLFDRAKENLPESISRSLSSGGSFGDAVVTGAGSVVGFTQGASEAASNRFTNWVTNFFGTSSASQAPVTVEDRTSSGVSGTDLQSDQATAARLAEEKAAADKAAAEAAAAFGASISDPVKGNTPSPAANILDSILEGGKRFLDAIISSFPNLNPNSDAAQSAAANLIGNSVGDGNGNQFIKCVVSKIEAEPVRAIIPGGVIFSTAQCLASAVTPTNITTWIDVNQFAANPSLKAIGLGSNPAENSGQGDQSNEYIVSAGNGQDTLYIDYEGTLSAQDLVQYLNDNGTLASSTLAEKLNETRSFQQQLNDYARGFLPNLSDTQRNVVVGQIVNTIVETSTQEPLTAGVQAYANRIALSIAKSLDTIGEIDTKINPNFAITVVGGVSVKVLPDDVKNELASLLTKAQQTSSTTDNVYSTLNSEFEKLKITKEDILYNFPNITLGNIATFERRGVKLYVASQGTISIGVSSASSNITTSSSSINANTGTVYLPPPQTSINAPIITNTVPKRGGYSGFKKLYDPKINAPKVAEIVRNLTLRVIPASTGNPGGYGIRYYAENFPIGLYKVFIPPGAIQLLVDVEYGTNAEPPLGPGKNKPPAQKVVVRYEKPPETTDPNAFNSPSDTQTNLIGTFRRIIGKQELRFYSEPGAGRLDIAKPGRSTATDSGNYCYINFLEAPDKTVKTFTFIVDVEKEPYEAWFKNAEWDVDGNPLGSSSHNYASFLSFSEAKGETLQERLFYYGESKVNGLTFSQRTKTAMDTVPDLAPNWAYKDLAKGDVGGYTQNPTANAVSGLESILTTLKDYANGSFGRVSIGEGDLGSYKNAEWEKIVIEGDITLNAASKFSEHTDRLSGPDENNTDPTKPTLTTGLNVGKSLTYVANQADSNRVEHMSIDISAKQKYQILSASAREQERIVEVTDSGFASTGVLRFLQNLYFLLIVLGPKRVLSPYTPLDPLDAFNEPSFDGNSTYSNKTIKRYDGFTIRSGKYNTDGGYLRNIMKFDFVIDENDIQFKPLIPRLEPFNNSPELIDLMEVLRKEDLSPDKWSQTSKTSRPVKRGDFNIKRIFDHVGQPVPQKYDPQGQIKFYLALLQYVKDAYPVELINAINKSIISIDSIPFSKPDPKSPNNVIVTYKENGNPQIASGGVDNSKIVTGAVSSLFVEGTIKKFRDDLFPYVKILSSSPEPTEDKLKEVSDLMKKAGDFLTRMRVDDEKFYENGMRILKEFSYVKGVSSPGETEEYLYRNVIGTPKLKKRLDSNYETAVPVNVTVTKVPYIVNPNFTPEQGNTQIGVIDDNTNPIIIDGNIPIDGGGVDGGGGEGGGGTPIVKPKPETLVYKEYPNISIGNFVKSFIELELLPGEIETLAETPISVSDTDLDMDRPYNYGCCCFNIFKCLCEPPKRNKKVGFNLYTTEGVWVEKSFGLKNKGSIDFKFDTKKCYFENNLSYSSLTSKLNGFNPYDYGSTETELIGITSANTGIIKAGETATVTFKTKKTTGVYGELNTESWIKMDTIVPDSTPYDFRSGVNASTEKSKINLVIPFSYDPEVLVKVPFTVDLSYGNEGSLFGSPTANIPAYWTLTEYSAYPKLAVSKSYGVDVPMSVGGFTGVKHLNNLRPVGQQRETKIITISNTDTPYKFKVAKSDVLKTGRTINVTSIQAVTNVPNNWNISLYTSSGTLVTTPFTIDPYEDVLLYARINTSNSFVSSERYFNPTSNTLLSPYLLDGQLIETSATREVVKYKVTTSSGQESYFGIYVSLDDIVGEYEEVITYSKTVAVGANSNITITGGKPDTKFKFITDSSSKNYKLLANGNYTLTNVKITSAGTYNYRFYFYGTDNERSIIVTAS